MTNILTPAEAAQWLRTTESDPVMLMLLPMIDSSITRATGRDWTRDATIDALAKAAAGILLVQWYDNPAQVGQGETPLALGAIHALAQLEAEALKYRIYTFYGGAGAGRVSVPGVVLGDVVQQLVGVYGASGDQSASFESVATETGSLMQTAGGDLSGDLFTVVVKHPAADVVP